MAAAAAALGRYAAAGPDRPPCSARADALHGAALEEKRADAAGKGASGRCVAEWRTSRHRGAVRGGAPPRLEAVDAKSANNTLNALASLKKSGSAAPAVGTKPAASRHRWPQF